MYKGFNFEFTINEKTCRLFIIAKSKKESIEMFKRWLFIKHLEGTEFVVSGKRRNKNNQHCFNEDYYNRELQVLGMEK